MNTVLIEEICQKYKDYLKEDYQDIVDYFGAKTALNICLYFGGSQHYIPKLDSFMMKCYEAYICEKGFEYTARQLSRELGISKRKVESIINKK